MHQHPSEILEFQAASYPELRLLTSSWAVTGGSGGAGGGGNGGFGGAGTPTQGAANTGGGGGGDWNGVTTTLNAGGSGVVIIKIPSTNTATFSGGVTQTNATSGGFTVYTVTATSTTSETVSFS